MIKLIFITLTIIYGTLNILAGTIGIAQKKTNLWSGLLMILGGFLVASLSISYIKNYELLVLIIGLVLIHASAIDNGIKMYGKVNLKHHIIRFLLSLMLILLWFLK